MKKISFYLISLLFGALLFTYSCGNTTEPAAQTQEVAAVSESQILVDYLEANGDFINSDKVPAMIKSKEVFENLENPKYLVIDLRSYPDWAKGHIPKSVNVDMKSLISYFEVNIKPADYDKITLVCYSGQTATFASSILRVLGYNNVFAMKWGMSSWNKDFAKKWETNLSSDYIAQLETKSNPKNAAGSLPTLTTGLTDPKAILKSRAKEVLNAEFKSVLVKPAELFSNGAAYYIVNYWPMPKYETGHIPGAIQYTPKKSISTKADILTLPTDKKIVVYCFTGQHSGFVTAYLRLLGYDAYSLGFGSNSFMHQKLVDNGAEEWSAFTKEEIHDYKVEVDKNFDESKAEGSSGGGCS